MAACQGFLLYNFVTIYQSEAAVDEQKKTEANKPKTAPAAPVQKPKPVDATPTTPATTQQLAEVEEQMSGFEKSTLRWAKTAVIMSGIAAIFVCAQWLEMHESGVDTHDLAVAAGNQAIAMNGQLDQMQLDERPWIKITWDPNVLHVGSAKMLMLHFTNTGKTPALNPDANVAMKGVKYGEKTFDFGGNLPTTDIHTGVIFPDPKGIDYMISRLKILPFENITVIPPPLDPITEPEMDAYNANKMYFVVFARVTYNDQSGGKHWTQFCIYIAKDNDLMPGEPAAENCVAYNAVDSNKNSKNPN